EANLTFIKNIEACSWPSTNLSGGAGGPNSFMSKGSRLSTLTPLLTCSVKQCKYSLLFRAIDLTVTQI
uniref:Uncharacterized protein n=1 Tax=Denticeps clupeoides TaxID=299321 RepID=A0AAY4DK38_9TELE